MCNDAVTEHQVVSYATIVPWELPYRLLYYLFKFFIFIFESKEKKIVKENREYFEIFNFHIDSSKKNNELFNTHHVLKLDPIYYGTS
jgi:hypothetical protein